MQRSQAVKPLYRRAMAREKLGKKAEALKDLSGHELGFRGLGSGVQDLGCRI